MGGSQLLSHGHSRSGEVEDTISLHLGAVTSLVTSTVAQIVQAFLDICSKNQCDKAKTQAHLL